jgi:hypothetical protein
MREEMIQAIWEHDLNAIREDMANGDTDYLSAILHGDGFTQYNNLSDQQLMTEVREHELLGPIIKP